MAKLTLLQIVQRVLSAIDSDQVTDVTETVEAEQVVDLVNTVYTDLLDDIPWYHRREQGQLEVTTSNHIMKIPNTTDHVYDLVIWYDGDRVTYINPGEMTYKLQNRDTSLSNVDSNGAITDSNPRYWTSYDDENIVFDSYNGTLAQALSTVYMSVLPGSLLSQNTDVPDLPDRLSSVLLWGVLEEAFRTLKGDEIAARAYQTKYLKAKAAAKRWARKVNKVTTTSPNDYGRKRVRIHNEISTHNVIEGS